MSMKKFCILMDTSGERETEKVCKDTYVLPFSIIINDGKKENIYEDWYQIERHEILEALEKGADVKTSQTPFGKVFDKIENLLKEYEIVFCISITKEFSGTYQSLLNIKKQLEAQYGQNRIIVIDTKGLGLIQTEIAKIIVKGMKEKKSTFDIEKDIKLYNQTWSGVTCITNATQLIKGGRLKGLKAILVKALNLKLLIRYEDGKLEYMDKAKNLAGAVDRGFDIIDRSLNFKKNPPTKVYIFSDLVDKDEEEKITNYLKLKFNEFDNIEFIEGKKMPAAVIAHLGNYSYSFLVVSESKK